MYIEASTAKFRGVLRAKTPKIVYLFIQPAVHIIRPSDYLNPFRAW